MARPGFSICVCPDSRLTKMHIDTMLAEYPPSGGGSLLGSSNDSSWERHIYWGDEPLSPGFWDALTLQDLFASPRVIIVNNAQNILADVWKTLSTTLGTPRDNVWPIFCFAVGFERGQPKLPAHIAKLQCLVFASSNKWLWSSPGLDAKGRADFVRSDAKRLGLFFAQGVFETVIARLPFDAAIIANEMQKLDLAAGDSKLVTTEHAAILELEPEPDIFSIIRNLQHGGNPAAVWQQAALSEQAADKDKMVFGFLAMLAREARQLWQLAMGEEVWLPSNVAAAKKNLARSLGLAGIAKLWQLALEADKGIKTGERSPDEALTSLFASLSLIFRRIPR